ncbi:MAG: LamG domain-containing protein, partial [Myxococcota bacterium]|nr:LamG domain-containing protein [Myxococcota bacterium]
ACDTGTYGQGTCATCAQEQLCHLERAKCSSTASPAPHPCETYCQDRLALTDPFHQPVCDGFFDGDITTCLATCSTWGTGDDVTAPTAACLLDQLAQLQTAPGGLPEGKACSDAGFQGLCADLDGDGQTPLQGDCEPDVSTIKTGGQLQCDGLANDCDEPGEVEGDDLCQEGQQCMNAVGCLDTVSCTAPHWVSPEGTTAWGVIPDADHLESAHLSVTAWIRPDASPDGYYILSLGRFGLSHDSGGIRVVVRFDCDLEAPGSPWISHNTGVHVEPDRWTHLGVTFDGLNLTTYVNGVAVAETAVSEDDAPATMGACEDERPWYLGRLSPGHEDGPDHFQGAMGDVTFWSEALSPTDMAAHVAKGSVPEGKLSSLTGWYPLEDAAIVGQTGALRDRSPYAHHGTWTQEGDDAQTAHTWRTFEDCPDTPIQCQWGANLDPPESQCVDEDGDGWSPLEGDCGGRRSRRARLQGALPFRDSAGEDGRGAQDGRWLSHQHTQRSQKLLERN